MIRVRLKYIPLAACLRRLCLLLAMVLAGCAHTPETVPPRITVHIVADGQTHTLDLDAGSTPADALEKAGLILSAMDRLDLAGDVMLSSGMEFRVIRVTEQFVLEEIAVPLDTQTVQNESLPQGATQVAQAGVSGLVQNTYRVLLEDGLEVSRTLFRQQIVLEAMPRIVMTGVLAPLTPVDLPGRLVYLSGGNAWLMQGSSDQRLLLTTSADLDGRVFSRSADGRWLLFTRALPESSGGDLNELWFLDTTSQLPRPVSLGIRNIIHFADWQPGYGMAIACSTVEPRPEAPGWQANNDLIRITFDQTGIILTTETLLEPNPGGVYGWWGTDFAWSPDGLTLAYSQTDSVGLLDVQSGDLTRLTAILPFQSGAATAWLPSLAWSADGKRLYFTTHGAAGSSDESSPVFSIASLAARSSRQIQPVARVDGGSAVYPSPAPWGRGDFSLVWLQADPQYSGNAADTDTAYHLFAAASGVDTQVEIPAPHPGAGFEPQTVQWCPDPAACQEPLVGVIYQGDIWLINLKTLQFHRLTGDGSVKLIDWEL